MCVPENIQTNPRKVTGKTGGGVGPQKPNFLQDSMRLYWNSRGEGPSLSWRGCANSFWNKTILAVLLGPNTTNLRSTLIPMFLLLTLDMFLAR